jgi:hypothetical protein
MIGQKFIIIYKLYIPRGSHELVYSSTFKLTTVWIQLLALLNRMISLKRRGLSWSWTYGSWIYNYLCNQCPSPLQLGVRTPLGRGILDTTLCDKICQLLATDRWFSQGTLVSSTNKTDCHDITKKNLKVALSTKKPTNQQLELT